MALVIGIAVLLLTRWPAAAIAALVGTLTLPRLLSDRPAARQLDRLEAIEGWMRKLTGLLAASHGLEDTLLTSAPHAPEPIRPQIRSLAGRLRAGMDTTEALYRLADDLDDPAGDLVAAALIEAAELRGRGLQALLNDLAFMVAADVAARREVQASRAPHLTTVKGVAVLLVIFGAALAWRHDYSAPYDTPSGQFVLAVLLTIAGCALTAMYRLATQPPIVRFLYQPRPLAGETES
jgi:Flp pilus assembly protein TadB